MKSPNIQQVVTVGRFFMENSTLLYTLESKNRVPGGPGGMVCFFVGPVFCRTSSALSRGQFFIFSKYAFLSDIGYLESQNYAAARKTNITVLLKDLLRNSTKSRDFFSRSAEKIWRKKFFNKLFFSYFVNKLSYPEMWFLDFQTSYLRIALG